MENIICFFCDIQGTINGKLKNNNNDYEKFKKLLINLKKKNNADYIIFSLFSSDDYESVEQQKRNLEKYLEFPIVLGKQFFDYGYIEDIKIIRENQKHTKIDQIFWYLNELENDYNYNIEKVYYVDDSSFFHDMLETTQEYCLNHPNKITSIIPKNGQGLSEVNQLLEDIINTERKVLVKNKI